MSTQNNELIQATPQETQLANPFGQSTPDTAVMAMSGADPAIVAAAESAKVQIQMAYFMATQAPRNPQVAWQKIIEECRRPKFAQQAIYKKPVGGETITGPSIRLAEAILRCWGNIFIRTQVIYEDESMRRALVLCIDLETNLSFSKEIVTPKTVERSSAGKDREVLGQRKNKKGYDVFIVRATEEEMRNKENSAISIAMRNDGLRLIPADIVDDAMSTALATRDNDIQEDPGRHIKLIISKFSVMNVGVADLEQWMGHGIKTVSPSEIDSMRSIYQAIEDSETTWNEVMELRNSKDPNKTAQSATENKAKDLKDRLAAETGEPAATSDAGETATTSGSPSGGSPASSPTDDFELMEWDALVNYANKAKPRMTPGQKGTARAAIEGKKSDILIKVLRALPAEVKS